jgi:hypothetical protein
LSIQSFYVAFKNQPDDLRGGKDEKEEGNRRSEKGQVPETCFDQT